MKTALDDRRRNLEFKELARKYDELKVKSKVEVLRGVYEFTPEICNRLDETLLKIIAGKGGSAQNKETSVK